MGGTDHRWKKSLGAWYTRPEEIKEKRISNCYKPTRARKAVFSAPSMPPRLVFSSVYRSLVIRTRPSIRPPQIAQITPRRGFADEVDRKPADGPNQNVLGNVSEEAADINRVTGETQPELNQGTPIQDVRLSIALQIWHHWLKKDS